MEEKAPLTPAGCSRERRGRQTDRRTDRQTARAAAGLGDAPVFRRPGQCQAPGPPRRGGTRPRRCEGSCQERAGHEGGLRGRGDERQAGRGVADARLPRRRSLAERGLWRGRGGPALIGRPCGPRPAAGRLRHRRAVWQPGRAATARKGAGAGQEVSTQILLPFCEIPIPGPGAGRGGSCGVSSLPPHTLPPSPAPALPELSQRGLSSGTRVPAAARAGGTSHLWWLVARGALRTLGADLRCVPGESPARWLSPPPPPLPGSVLSAQEGEGEGWTGFLGPQGRVGVRRALGGGPAPVLQVQRPTPPAGPPQGPVAGW